MNKRWTLIAGMVITLGACSSMADKKSNVVTPWAGTYTHHTEVRGADDGTDDYKLEIQKAGSGYEVSYTHSSMCYFTYKGTGKENRAGGLEVVFSNFESSLIPTKNFKPGNHMFTLNGVKVGPRTGIKLDWEMVPGDDLKKSSVTMFREDPKE